LIEVEFYERVLSFPIHVEELVLLILNPFQSSHSFSVLERKVGDLLLYLPLIIGPGADQNLHGFLVLCNTEESHQR
jgi:hypothetical protein